MIGSLFYIFLGIMAGMFIIGSKLLIVLTIFGGVVLLVSFVFKPEIGILAIVFLTASIIFEQAAPLFSIGVGSLHVSDIFLLFLFCVIFFRLSTDKKFRLAKTPLDIPLILFYLTIIISAFISIAVFKVDFNIVMREFRHVSYYLTFFLITNLIVQKEKMEFLIKGLFAIAVVVGLVMIIQATIGQSFHLMQGG